MPEPSVAQQLAHPPLIIEYRDPRELAANPANYRHHPPEQISEIKRSLQDLGQYRNVVCRPDGTLLAGHGVVQAAIDLGWEQIAVHVFAGSEAKARRLMVADNELARGAEDDERALHALLNEIDRDFGDLAGTGWSDAEHEARLAELAAEDFGLAKGAQEDPGDDYDITVAVVDVDEHAEKKLNLALNNRNIQGDWDEEALADILRECSEVDYSDIGVTDADLEVLLGTVEGSDYRELLTEGEERKAVKGSLAEIKASEARMREKTADENVVDFYTVIVFESFQERDEFCEALGLHPGDKYIRGADLMRLLLVPNGGE